MKIKIVASKTANLFFFVANLSNWHFSCVPEYNHAWLKKTGKLSKEDEMHLKKLRRCLKKYDFKKSGMESLYLGTPFFKFQEKRAWKELGRRTTKQEAEIVREILRHFSPRFQSVFMEARPRLACIKTNLLDALKKKEVNKAFDILEKLFQSGFSAKERTIVLLAIPEESSLMGGTCLEQGLITLEVSSPQKEKDFLSVFLHELAHELAEKSFHFPKTVQAFVKKNQRLVSGVRSVARIFKRSVQEFFEETAIFSFIPDGYLGEKYFGSRTKVITSRKEMRVAARHAQKGDWSALEKYIITGMRKLNKEYAEKQRALDEDYLRFLARLVNAVRG